MNVIELPANLQVQHDQITARPGELRDQIEHLTAALAETEARLADLTITQKVIAELAPAGDEPGPPAATTAYQAIVNAFNQHSGRAFRAREPHELLGMPPTRHLSTSPATAVSDASPAKASSPSPDEAATRNGLNAHSEGIKRWFTPIHVSRDCQL